MMRDAIVSHMLQVEASFLLGVVKSSDSSISITNHIKIGQGSSRCPE